MVTCASDVLLDTLDRLLGYATAYRKGEGVCLPLLKLGQLSVEKLFKSK